MKEQSNVVAAPRRLRRIALAAFVLLLGVVGSYHLVLPPTASGVSTNIVISQVYGGGGNVGATYTNDFIELFNRGISPVDVTGWSVQYASSAGTTWQVTTLSGSIAPGQYYLVQEAAGAGGTTPLPTPDASGSIAMSAASGKVALASTAVTLSGSCPTGGAIIDFVGYGAANCFEGSAAAPGLTNTTAALRINNGCAETDDNAADFASGAPNPRNTASPTNPCNATTDPTGVGAADPNTVTPGNSSLLTVTVTPGTNPTSTGITVTGDLTSIGGSAAQQFFDDGSNGDVTADDNIFSFQATVGAATTPGAKTLNVSLADAQARTNTTTISLTVQSATITPGSVVISQIYGGGGNSGAVFKNDFIELFNRTSSPISVTGWSVQYASAAGTSFQVTNLSGTIQPGKYYLVQEGAGAGGTINLPTPDATGGIAMSATSGKVALVGATTALTGACPSGATIVDFVGYGSSATCFEGSGPTSTLSNTTAAHRVQEGCIDTDNNGPDFFTAAPNPRNSASPFNDCNVVIPTLAIYEIQGSGSTSPFANQIVSTTFNIVTGLKSNGFFIQTPDGAVDGDPNTSEGIFVFTSGAPTVAIGDGVTVRARVSEFIPSADPSSPPLTELSNGPLVTIFSSGNSLPSPIALTAADTDPAGSIEQLEKYEGMRVHVDSLTVVGPTLGSTNEANATGTSNGVFYGVITGIARPFREPGIEVPDPLPAGSPCCVPRFDANPERLRIDSDGQPGALNIDVTTGALVTNVTGPVDYSFRTYTIVPDAATPPSVSGNIIAVPVPAPGSDEFTVATFNMERFFDTVDDPGISDVALTATAFNNRLNKASLTIRDVMRTPDVIGVEEMENLTTLQAVANKVNADAIAGGDPDPNYQAYLVEGNDIGGIDVGFLVKSARVGVIDVTQEGKDTTYIDPTNNQPALLNDRPPLILRATIQPSVGQPFPVTVIVNHLRSLSGVDDPSDGARVRAKRRAQAEFLADLIQARQSADPNEHIISVGDYNAFQFNDGYVDSIGTIKGTPTPEDQVVLASNDLVDPDLTDLLELEPADQRYSFVFDGNAQELDHILVTPNLLELRNGLHYARVNADFPEVFRSDANRPERLSDHDPSIAYFNFPQADLEVTKSASPNPVTTGSQLAYTITVTNNGPNTAVDVGLSDLLDANTLFQSISAVQGWSCTTPTVGSSGTIDCSTASIASGGSVSFVVVTEVPCVTADGTTISNTATVSSTTTDPDSSNDSRTASVTASNPAPIISGVSITPSVIWPGNHLMVDATVSYSVGDNCGPVTCSLSVSSNEPVNGDGDGNTSPDWVVIDPHHVQLRAERSGTGEGRTYIITITCTDSAGNSSTETVTATVPHS
jgi:uncharacterized protein